MVFVSELNAGLYPEIGTATLLRRFEYFTTDSPCTQTEVAKHTISVVRCVNLN